MSARKSISNSFTVNTVIDGDDAAIAFATPSQISIPCYYTGYVKAQKITSVTFSLKVGTNAATVTRVTSGTKPTGVAVTGVAANAVTITVGTSATASGLSTGVTFTVTGTYGGKTYSATVTVALIGSTQGEQGERGKVGRFFYFGGTFNAADTTQTFIVNDAQAPYFEHTETITTQSGTTTIKRYHVFNYETNGSYTMAQMWAISSKWNNKPWEVMTNDFKYIISEVLFANFAKLGSFVISGDWMLSTNGKINGTDYNDGAMYNGASAYTWFDPSYPNTDHTKTVTISGQQVTVHNFIPNLAFDGRTGTTYQQDAHVKGEIRATGGTIGGFVISPTQISSNNNNIVLNSNGYAKLGGFEVATNATASLKSTLTVGNKTSQRIEIIPFERNQVGSGTINFINADSYKVLKIGFYNDNYGAIDFYSPATNQNPEECAVSVRSNYLQISSENTDNGKESYITMLTSTNNAYSQYAFDDKVNKMFLTSGIEGGTLMLRAHKQDGSSAWPTASVPMRNYPSMTKGLVHVISLGSLKDILDNQASYSLSYGKLSVMLVQTS